MVTQKKISFDLIYLWISKFFFLFFLQIYYNRSLYISETTRRRFNRSSSVWNVFLSSSYEDIRMTFSPQLFIIFSNIQHWLILSYLCISLEYTRGGGRGDIIVFDQQLKVRDGEQCEFSFFHLDRLKFSNAAFIIETIWKFISENTIM